MISLEPARSIVKVLLFGASGMVGQGTLRECLLDPSVERVLSVGRSRTGIQHPKLEELVVPALPELSEFEDRLGGYDACLFCLGVSSLGRTEAEYTRVTHDLTLEVARTLLRLNPTLVFEYVSGAGTDATERGRSMWARVKGRTENELLRMPFRAAYMFRPGAIQPVHGVRSHTLAYRVVYVFVRPFLPILLRWAPDSVTTSERMGRAMVRAARDGAATPRLETRDINELGRA